MRHELYAWKILVNIRKDLNERFALIKDLARDGMEQAVRENEINFAIGCIEDELGKLRQRL